MRMPKRVLVAGVGNIFLTDDGFGVEVVRRLLGMQMPPGVEVADFGIRGVHLAYQLMEGYDTLVMVDVAPRGGSPGDLYLIEPESADATAASAAAVEDGVIPLVDAHGMEPGSMLAMLELLGGRVGKIWVVGCEPADVSEGIGLTPEVEAAVPRAVEMILDLIEKESGRPVMVVPERKEG